MVDKFTVFWEEKAKNMKAIWKDVLQIAIYNTGLSEQGNLVVVLKNDNIEELVKAHKIVQEIRRKNIPAPLIVSPHYIKNSLDSFPLEFLNIKSDYQNLVVQEDIFKELQFDKKYIRLEMERELKSKELLIKMTVLDNFGRTKTLKELISFSIKSIEPVLKGLLFLLDQQIPKERKQLIYQADEITEFDISSLLNAVEYTTGTRNFTKNELPVFFEKFTRQLLSLSDYVEKYNNK